MPRNQMDSMLTQSNLKQLQFFRGAFAVVVYGILVLWVNKLPRPPWLPNNSKCSYIKREFSDKILKKYSELGHKIDFSE